MRKTERKGEKNPNTILRKVSYLLVKSDKMARYRVNDKIIAIAIKTK